MFAFILISLILLSVYCSTSTISVEPLLVLLREGVLLHCQFSVVQFKHEGIIFVLSRTVRNVERSFLPDFHFKGVPVNFVARLTVAVTENIDWQRHLLDGCIICQPRFLKCVCAPGIYHVGSHSSG